jgi:hypothetical protein
MTDKTQTKLIENLKKQLENKEVERLAKQYLLAIQSVVKDIMNEPPKPLTFISGSSTIYDIDNIQCIVDKYTPYPTTKQI